MEDIQKNQKVADAVGEVGLGLASYTAAIGTGVLAGVGARAIIGKAVTTAIVTAAKRDLRVQAVIGGIGLLTWAGAKAYKWAIGYKAVHEVKAQ